MQVELSLRHWAGPGHIYSRPVSFTPMVIQLWIAFDVGLTAVDSTTAHDELGAMADPGATMSRNGFP
jgi:hypothetical protein